VNKTTVQQKSTTVATPNRRSVSKNKSDATVKRENNKKEQENKDTNRRK
jgi:hypothetical protein